MPATFLCVYCGSKTGQHARYREAAAELGRLMAARDIGLVYGGGSIGLMGVIADAVMEAGGEVIGVIPKRLATKELAHEGITRLEVVSSMHERKARMVELSQYFAALPGGFGTFEEAFETITWAQLGIHAKPIGFLNVEGYFSPLAALIDHAISEQFIDPKFRELMYFTPHPEELLAGLDQHRAPRVRRWVSEDET